MSAPLSQSPVSDALNLAGRVLIAVLFLGGTGQKLLDPTQVQGMLMGIGLSTWLVWPVAVFNLVAAVALVLGPWVRAWALVLAGYCLFTSFFHWQLRADPWQVTIMVKNWSIAGGLLILAASGPGRYVAWQARLWPWRPKPDR
ncbi:putative membrane protein [Roseibacterium elongatum DSM 19469]|uniref:Putative membrane protein n=1 Tax=Roseicyclus elongatus DSM 19469 TaxID=1294273 RepID=W8SNU5_9RHOB|nr:DoxX family protein [Roseibacterium elongatum]AHM04210.1 putative membrane protein [Roseibacterium elongatum DSM 19469]